MARAAELRTSSEKSLFAVGFLLSLVVWVLIVVSIFGLLYGLMIGLFLFIAHALMIAQVKGNGVRISEGQFPDLHRRVSEAARKLGLDKAPDAYVMQAGGLLNAFATKFVGRNFMVIYSDLLEACDDEGREIDMIIGHELGHLALGHLRWIWFLMPARITPWLGPAYSRACEYSCDLCGYEAAGDFEAAARGLAVLAAGGKYGRQVNLETYVRQAADTRGFWTSVYELNASHPFLPKRIAALANRKNPGAVPSVGRHPLAYPLAPMLSFGGAPGAGPLIIVAVIAILAAIAIPQYAQFRARAQQARMKSMDSTLQSLSEAAQAYRAEKSDWPCSMDDLDVPQMTSYAREQGWELQMDCKSGLAAVVYHKEGKKLYRAIYFENGNVEDGEL